MSQNNNMKLICRICMCENSEMKSILDEKNFCGRRLSIKSFITMCASVQVLDDDNLPKKVCLECLNNLHKFAAFKQLCYLSDFKLRNGCEMLYLEFDDVFNDKCRVCLNDNHDVKSIFDLENFSGELLEITEVIKKCAHVQINNYDVLPKLICLKCLSKLHDTYNFKHMCERNDYNLRNYNFVQSRVEVKTEISSEDYFGETTFLADSVLDDVIVKEEPEFKNETHTEMLSFEEIKCETVSDDMKNECDENIEDPLNYEQITYLKTGEISLNEYSIIDGSSIEKHKQPLKLFECYYCGKKFSLKQYLRQHIKWHSGEKPFKCDTCDGQFTTAGSLKVHRRMHTGERPYRCNVCSKSFFASTGLSKHKVIHTGQRPACDICGKHVCDKNSLYRHKLTHETPNPQGCDVCGKMFMRPHYLIAHKRKWRHEKLFNCDICDKQFIKQENLFSHSKIHIAEKSVEEPTA